MPLRQVLVRSVENSLAPNFQFRSIFTVIAGRFGTGNSSPCPECIAAELGRSTRGKRIAGQRRGSTEPCRQPDQRAAAEQHQLRLWVFQSHAGCAEHSASDSVQHQQGLDDHCAHHSAGSVAALSQPEHRWRVRTGRYGSHILFSPRKPEKVIWGVGPALTIPTATNDILGQGKLSLGPSVVVLAQPGKWTLGDLVNNVWSVAGSGSRPPVNQMLNQYFITTKSRRVGMSLRRRSSRRIGEPAAAMCGLCPSVAAWDG